MILLWYGSPSTLASFSISAYIESMEIRTLEHTSLETIRLAFCKAFSDYELPVNLSLEKLREMIIERDLHLDLSVGSFDEEELIGFILCGYRSGISGSSCYDGGTGVVPEYRGKKIASALLERVLHLADSHAIDTFILEVLEHNRGAQALYRRAGFSIHRYFRCYRMSKPNQSSERVPAGYELVSLEKGRFTSIFHAQLLPYAPSWQHDVPSILNTWESQESIAILSEDTIEGYGVIHRERGTIAQVALPAGGDTELFWNLLIAKLAERTTASVLSLVNVESNSLVTELCEAHGWENFVNQYEMIRYST